MIVCRMLFLVCSRMEIEMEKTMVWRRILWKQIIHFMLFENLLKLAAALIISADTLLFNHYQSQ